MRSIGNKEDSLFCHRRYLPYQCCEKGSQLSSEVTLMSTTHAPPSLNVSPSDIPFHATLPPQICHPFGGIVVDAHSTRAAIPPASGTAPAESGPLPTPLPVAAPEESNQPTPTGNNLMLSILTGALPMYKTLRVESWLPPDLLHVSALCHWWR